LLPFSRETSVFSSAVKKRKNWKIKIIILLVVLYGNETWHLALREEHRLRVLENRVFRKFETKRNEVTVDWKYLQK
jgi:hypothetical protein